MGSEKRAYFPLGKIYDFFWNCGMLNLRLQSV